MLTTTIKRILEQIEDNQLEDLVLVEQQLAMLQTGCVKNSVEVPEWVEDGLVILSGEIDKQNRAALMKDLKLAEAEIEALQTPAERRKKAQATRDRLRKKLGM